MKPDDAEYLSFVTARYRTLVRAAVLFGCSRQDAEDAVQDTLIRCYSGWSRVVAADDRDAYVYRILVNGISRSRRRRWRGELPHGEVPEPAAVEDPAADVVLSQSVHAALGRLGPDQRQVVVLRYFADLSEAQISRVLGIRPGTVKSRASRALVALGADTSLAALSHPSQETP
ncbi:SigE family RNA polymerase sigma factor [Nocardioides sp.]|uniref:SigE family RNA polymerase sigma factor n=1 Tax=Nocardioides sp. TaxID=35761 RepID=UPI003D0C11F5